MKTFLVIPAYNEQSRLPIILEKISKHFPIERVIVVDDGSSEKLKLNQDVLTLRHELNLGKGAAMKTGAKFAFSKGADAIIFMDADGQHDPEDLSHFVNKLKGGYDVVFGSRRPNLSVPLIRFLGNKIASVYINILFGVYVSDLLSGYRALTKKAYKKLYWTSDRYGVETEMVARLGNNKKNLKWVEIPIEAIYIDKYKGVTIIDAINVLINSVWWKLS